MRQLEFGIACCFNILIGIWHIGYFFFIFCPAIIWTWGTSLEDGAKLTFVAANFLQKYPWCYTIPFQFHFFLNWTISAFVSPRLAQKLPTNSLLPSGKAMFFWIDLRCFRPLGKFQHNVDISIKTAHVSTLSFRFLLLCFEGTNKIRAIVLGHFLYAYFEKVGYANWFSGFMTIFRY